jgi:hypothetical protein
MRAGDICFVESGDGDYKVAKILVVEQAVIHVRLYKERFSEIPRFLDVTNLNLGTIDDADFGVGHLPLSRGSFAAWLPVRVQHQPVTEEELEGFRIWEESRGGTWA